MLVRIRFRAGPKVRRAGTKNQRLALAFAALLMPAILGAWALALWRLAADLGKASSFAIERGMLSHWQVWLAIALALHAIEAALSRYGRRPVMIPESESSLWGDRVAVAQRSLHQDRVEPAPEFKADRF